MSNLMVDTLNNAGFTPKCVIPALFKSHTTFNNIAWEPHHQNICKYPKPRQTTLVKYLHGWLATTSRRYKQGVVLTDVCPLCGKPDTSFHMFQCTDSNMSNLGSNRWTECKNQIIKVTLIGHREVLFAGINTVFGHSTPGIYTITLWPLDLRKAYYAQTSIGWKQVFYGRLAKDWDTFGNAKVDTTYLLHTQWIGAVIKHLWGFGLDIWSLRN